MLSALAVVVLRWVVGKFRRKLLLRHRLEFCIFGSLRSGDFGSRLLPGVSLGVQFCHDLRRDLRLFPWC